MEIERSKIDRGGDLIEVDFARELQIAFDKARQLSGLTLTVLEMADIKQRIEFLRDNAKESSSYFDDFSPGISAAVWFLADNYGYDAQGEVKKLLLGIDRSGFKKGLSERKSRVYFQRKQDERNKL